MLVTTKLRNKDPGPSGPGADSNKVDTVSGAAIDLEPIWRCPDCVRTLPSERGLGMHRHHRHPLEVNEERIAIKASRRKMWTTSEDTLLVGSANRTWHDGMTKGALYNHLHTIFPQRSEEAIKRRLRIVEWQPKALIQQAHTPENRPSQPEEPTSPPVSHAQIHRTAGMKWSKEEEVLLRASANSFWKKIWHL